MREGGRICGTLRSHKRALTLSVWLNFLSRVKVYSNEHPPWSELYLANKTLLWSFEKHSLSAIHRQENCVKLYRRL